MATTYDVYTPNVLEKDVPLSSMYADGDALFNADSNGGWCQWNGDWVCVQQGRWEEVLAEAEGTPWYLGYFLVAFVVMAVVIFVLARDLDEMTRDCVEFEDEVLKLRKKKKT